jgi:hypothetical protein
MSDNIGFNHIQAPHLTRALVSLAIYMCVCIYIYIYKLPLILNFMVTQCINDIQHFFVQLMHTTLKSVELLKDFFKKLLKLLQHVSVYKETIIREPQPVLN